MTRRVKSPYLWFSDFLPLTVVIKYRQWEMWGMLNARRNSGSVWSPALFAAVVEAGGVSCRRVQRSPLRCFPITSVQLSHVVWYINFSMGAEGSCHKWWGSQWCTLGNCWETLELITEAGAVEVPLHNHLLHVTQRGAMTQQFNTGCFELCNRDSVSSFTSQSALWSAESYLVGLKTSGLKCLLHPGTLY